MNKFEDLTLLQQATIVLINILEGVISGRFTMAGVEPHVNQLFKILSQELDVPLAEANLVTNAVAERGVEALPGYPTEAA